LITQLVDLLVGDKFWIGCPEGAESRNLHRSSIRPIPCARSPAPDPLRADRATRSSRETTWPAEVPWRRANSFAVASTSSSISSVVRMAPSNLVSDQLAGKVLGCTYNYVHTAMASLPSRVFMNGHSQAVRIPAEFRLATDRVQISRTPEGDLLIHPAPRQRGGALLAALEGFDSTFAEALEQNRASVLPIQDREGL